ncbi:hypothetical protein FACS1894113_0920 [Alphaproteobacteria bacterium]|nr:hypothetical protein FACS1894113_0920 [Alphaproteobacteria bacterium]
MSCERLKTGVSDKEAAVVLAELDSEFLTVFDECIVHFGLQGLSFEGIIKAGGSDALSRLVCKIASSSEDISFDNGFSVGMNHITSTWKDSERDKFFEKIKYALKYLILKGDTSEIEELCSREDDSKIAFKQLSRIREKHKDIIDKEFCRDKHMPVVAHMINRGLLNSLFKEQGCIKNAFVKNNDGLSAVALALKEEKESHINDDLLKSPSKTCNGFQGGLAFGFYKPITESWKFGAEIERTFDSKHKVKNDPSHVVDSNGRGSFAWKSNGRLGLNVFVVRQLNQSNELKFGGGINILYCTSHAVAIEGYTMQEHGRRLIDAYNQAIDETKSSLEKLQHYDAPAKRKSVNSQCPLQMSIIAEHSYFIKDNLCFFTKVAYYPAVKDKLEAVALKTSSLTLSFGFRKFW